MDSVRLPAETVLHFALLREKQSPILTSPLGAEDRVSQMCLDIEVLSFQFSVYTNHCSLDAGFITDAGRQPSHQDGCARSLCTNSHIR